MDNLGFSAELISGIKYGAAAFLLLTGFFAVMRFRRTNTDNEDLSYTTAGANDINLDDADKFSSYIVPVVGDGSPATGNGSPSEGGKASQAAGYGVRNSGSDVTSELLNSVEREEGGDSDGYSLLFREELNTTGGAESVDAVGSRKSHGIQSPEGYLMRLNDTIEDALGNVADDSGRSAHSDGATGNSSKSEGVTVTGTFDSKYLTEQSCEMLKGFIPPEYGEPTISKAFNDVIIFTSLANNQLYHIYMLSPDLTDNVPLKRKFIQGCRKLATLSTACEPGMLPEFVDLSLEMWPILVCKSSLKDLTPKRIDKSWLCPALGKWIIDISRTLRYIHDNEWAVGRIDLLKEALCDECGERVNAVFNRFNFNSTDCLPEAKKKDCAAVKGLARDLLLQVPGKPSSLVIENLCGLVDAILTKDKREIEKAMTSYKKLEASLPCVSA